MLVLEHFADLLDSNQSHKREKLWNKVFEIDLANEVELIWRGLTFFWECRRGRCSCRDRPRPLACRWWAKGPDKWPAIGGHRRTRRWERHSTWLRCSRRRRCHCRTTPPEWTAWRCWSSNLAGPAWNSRSGNGAKAGERLTITRKNYVRRRTTEEIQLKKVENHLKPQ